MIGTISDDWLTAAVIMGQRQVESLKEELTPNGQTLVKHLFSFPPMESLMNKYELILN